MWYEGHSLGKCGGSRGQPVEVRLAFLPSRELEQSLGGSLGSKDLHSLDHLPTLFENLLSAYAWEHTSMPVWMLTVPVILLSHRWNCGRT